MRKLAYLFMTSIWLSASPCLPSRKAAERARANWVAITAGFSMAIASADLRLGPRQGHCRCYRGIGPQSCSAPRHSVCSDSGLVLIESLALYTLAIIFLKVK